MSCQHCNYHYCWLCNSKWESSHYTCSRPPITSDPAERQKEEMARYLDSVLTFRQLYLIHLKARKTDKDIIRQTLAVAEIMVKDRAVSAEDISNIFSGLEYLVLVC